MLTFRRPKGRIVQSESSYDILLEVDQKTQRQREGPRVAIPGELSGMTNYRDGRTGISAFAFVVDPAIASLTVEGYNVFRLGGQAMELHFSPFGLIGGDAHRRVSIPTAVALGVEGIGSFLNALPNHNTVILGVTNAYTALACTRLGFEMVDQDLDSDGKIKQVARDRDHVAMAASGLELEVGLRELMTSRSYGTLLRREYRLGASR